MTTTNEYHLKIMKMANIEFENIQTEDVLTWDYFDQGFGMRSWYHLYRPEGDLKDIQCGDPIPVSERLFSRPAYKKSKEMLAAEESQANARERKREKTKQKEAKKAAKKAAVLMVINPGIPLGPITKKEKAKRNLSPEERAKRAERMRAVAQKYWAEKRKTAKPMME